MNFIVADPRPVEMFFLVDNSKNAKEATLQGIGKFIMQVAKIYKISENGSRIGIISYGSSARKQLRIDEGTSLAAIEEALAKIKETDEPRYAVRALESVRDIVTNAKDGIRKDVGKIAILFTTGKSVASSLERMTLEMLSLGRAGVDIAVIGIGSDLDRKELMEGITSPDQFVQVPTVAQISEATASISESVRNTQQLVGKLDLSFILGASGPDADKDFEMAIHIVKELVKRIDVSRDTTRIGLVTYGDRAKIILRFDGTVNKEGVLAKIDSLAQPRHGVALSSAIDMSTNFIFHELYGARRDSPKTAVIFSNELDSGSKLAAERLRKKGVRVIGIALGRNGDTEAMKDISSSGKDVVKIEGKDNLSKVRSVLSKLLPGKI